MIVISTEHNRL